MTVPDGPGTRTVPIDLAESRLLLNGTQLLGFVEGTSKGRTLARGANDPPDLFNLWRRQDFDQPTGTDEDGGTVWEHWCALRDITPVWLLQFTGMAMDARLLKFDLPDISDTLGWGSAGYEDARRWPLLPVGTIMAGEPIPDGRRRATIVDNSSLHNNGALSRLWRNFLERTRKFVLKVTRIPFEKT